MAARLKFMAEASSVVGAGDEGGAHADLESSGASRAGVVGHRAIGLDSLHVTRLRTRTCCSILPILS